MALRLTAWKHLLSTGEDTLPLIRNPLSLLHNPSQPWQSPCWSTLKRFQERTDFPCSAHSSLGAGWALIVRLSLGGAPPSEGPGLARVRGLHSLSGRGHTARCLIMSHSQHCSQWADPLESLLYFVLCSNGRFFFSGHLINTRLLLLRVS